MPTTRPRSDAGPFSYLRHVTNPSDNALLRQDGLLFRNGFRRAFAGLRDRMLLLTIAVCAAAAFAQAVVDPPPIPAIGALTLIVLTGLATHHAARSHLAWSGAHAALAASALDVRMGRQYLLTRHCLACALSVSLLLPIRPALALWSVPAYAVGLLAGMPNRPRPRRSTIEGDRPSIPAATTLMAIILRQQTGLRGTFRPWVATLAQATLTAAIQGLLRFMFGQTATTMIAVLPCTIIMLRLTRVDGPTIRFANAIGKRTGVILRAHLCGPASFILPAVLILLPFLPAVAAAILATGGLFLWIMVLRILLRQFHPPTRSDRELGCVAAALVLLAPLVKFLTPLLAIGYSLHLVRRAGRSRWTLP